MSRRPTYAQIAADFRLWQEYADPNGTMDQPAFDETPMDERLGLLKQAFGPELPALEPGFYGVTELHRATWDGDVGQVRQLLAQGMHVDAADLDGDTPLLAAARNGHERLLDVLLEAGADPFLENHEGESPSQYLIVQSRVVDPVHHAVASGDTATLADLIDSGANLRRFDKNGNTPAHVALAQAYRYDLGLDRIDVDTKQRAVLDMLLRADPDLVDVPNGQHRETLQSQVDAMDLAGCPSPPLAAANPQEAMWVALFKGDAAELADVLNRCHADVNQRTSDGATPLHVAAKNGRAAQVKTLLAHQADPTAAWCGMTPLYVATSAGHANTMGVLLNAGSDPLAALQEAARSTWPPSAATPPRWPCSWTTAWQPWTPGTKAPARRRCTWPPGEATARPAACWWPMGPAWTWPTTWAGRRWTMPRATRRCWMPSPWDRPTGKRWLGLLWGPWWPSPAHPLPVVAPMPSWTPCGRVWRNWKPPTRACWPTGSS